MIHTIHVSYLVQIYISDGSEVMSLFSRGGRAGGGTDFGVEGILLLTSIGRDPDYNEDKYQN